MDLAIIAPFVFGIAAVGVGLEHSRRQMARLDLGTRSMNAWAYSTANVAGSVAAIAGALWCYWADQSFMYLVLIGPIVWFAGLLCGVAFYWLFRAGNHIAHATPQIAGNLASAGEAGFRRAQQVPMSELQKRLAELNRMRSEGVINESEYASARARALETL